METIPSRAVTTESATLGLVEYFFFFLTKTTVIALTLCFNPAPLTCHLSVCGSLLGVGPAPPGLCGSWSLVCVNSGELVFVGFCGVVFLNLNCGVEFET